MSTEEARELIDKLMKEQDLLRAKLKVISDKIRYLVYKSQNMLMHIIQLTEDDEDEGYDLSDSAEQSDAYINIYQVASVTADEDNDKRCFVYMANEDYFYIDEPIDDFINRYQAILYGSVLTKFYNSSNKQN